MGRPGYPGARPHGRRRSQARGARRHPAGLPGPRGLQPLLPRTRDRPHAPTGGDLRPLSGPGHGQDGHPRVPALAPGGGAPGQARRLRSHLCLRRPRPHHDPAFPLPPLQPADRRVRRQPGEQGAPGARADRGHQGGGRRQLRRAAAPGGRGAARRRRPHGRGRRPRNRRAAGRVARPLGREPEHLGERFPTLALRRGRLSGALR